MLTTALATALSAAVCFASPAAAAGRDPGNAIVSVLEVESSDANRAEAEFWYGQMVAALDSLTGVSTRRDSVPGATDLPHQDFEHDLDEVSRIHAAAWSTLRAGRWLASVRLSEEGLWLASKFDSPPLPGTLLRDLYLVQAHALLAADRDSDARDALRAAMALDPYWQPAQRGTEKRFLGLFDELRDAQVDGLSGTLAVVSPHRDTQVMVHGVSQGWIGERQFSMALPVGEYQVTSRRPGHADRTDTVSIRDGQRTALRVKLRKGSSSAFHPGLMHALAKPGAQRKAGVWTELESARTALGSDSILAARYGDGTDGFDGLLIGLYLPGREGWSFYRRIPLSHDLARDSLLLEKLSDELLMAVNQRLGKARVAGR
jgi:hypothetical protein